MKKLFILVGILYFILFLGWLDQYRSNPTRGCKEFNTYTEFRGFDCKNKTVYTVR